MVNTQCIRYTAANSLAAVPLHSNSVHRAENLWSECIDSILTTHGVMAELADRLTHYTQLSAIRITAYSNLHTSRTAVCQLRHTVVTSCSWIVWCSLMVRRWNLKKVMITWKALTIVQSESIATMGYFRSTDCCRDTGTWIERRTHVHSHR